MSRQSLPACSHPRPQTTLLYLGWLQLSVSFCRVGSRLSRLNPSFSSVQTTNLFCQQVTKLKSDVVGRALHVKVPNILSSDLGPRTIREVLGLQAAPPGGINFLLRYLEPLAAKQCTVERPPDRRHPMHTEDERAAYTLPHFGGELVRKTWKDQLS